MLFNSYQFIIFFIVVFVAYWNMSRAWQNRFLLVASYVFYGWWSWKLLFLIFLATFINYYCGSMIHKAPNQRKRKFFLCISLVTTLVMLFFFKYSGFFVSEFYDFLHFVGFEDVSRPFWKIALPIGISFYTFQTLSYTIDIYRGKLKPVACYVDFSLFVVFFPQLVAGPIERASHLLPQITSNRTYDYDKIVSGFRLALYGMFQKVVIADTLAKVVDAAYKNPYTQTSGTFLVATCFFAFQIYCDFAGYTNIARGVAKMLGFDLCLNFNAPYLSKNLVEFWRRWHMSLTGWFRDYVYFSLGGNRVSQYRHFFNVMAVFLLSGLWHGANWTFVIWGFIHGLFFLITLIFAKLIEKAKHENLAVHILKIFATFVVVCFAWIFFRANSLSESFYIVEQLADFNSFSLKPVIEYYVIKEASVFGFSNIHVGVALICGLMALEWTRYYLPAGIPKMLQRRWITYPLYYTMITLCLYSTSEAPFIYFQF